MEHENNQPVPAALLIKKGPEEFNTPIDHGAEVSPDWYQQVLVVVISWSATMQ